MGESMYFLKKRTVFFELPGSGIFHYLPETIGLQMCLPPPPDIALYAPQSPQAGRSVHRFLQIPPHSDITWGLAIEFSGYDD